MTAWCGHCGSEIGGRPAEVLDLTEGGLEQLGAECEPWESPRGPQWWVAFYGCPEAKRQLEVPR